MVRELRRGEKVAVTVTDQFKNELDNLIDERGNPCEFEITIEVRSPGHGDTIAMQLAQAIRMGAYDAMDEFDEMLEERDENQETL